MVFHKAIDSFFTRFANGHESFKKYVAELLENDEALLLMQSSAIKQWAIDKLITRIELRVIPENLPAYVSYGKHELKSYLHYLYLSLS
jgi:hypothetical protein